MKDNPIPRSDRFVAYIMADNIPKFFHLCYIPFYPLTIFQGNYYYTNFTDVK